MTQPPQLTFFCELDPEPLDRLFSAPGLILMLQRLRAAVSLGLMDASPERAALVRRLNEAGIPVTAWLLLPKEQGYWFNLGNVERALARYTTFKAWTALRGLQWAAVGLDIEPDIRALQTLAASKLKGLRGFLRSLPPKTEYTRSAALYRGLVDEIRRDGWPVESYQFPFIADERAAGSRLVQRLSGVVDLPVDREVFMLYSSFYPAVGAGMLVSYGPAAGGIGLGSTGGGVTMEGLVSPDPLEWAELRRDLLLAAPLCSRLYIFSLEGCVERGYLEQIAALDWDQPQPLPPWQVTRIHLARKLLRLGLRVGRVLAQ